MEENTVRKTEIVDLLLALEEKYYHLMEVAEASKDWEGRLQYFAMVAAYDEAVRIVASEDYAKQVKKELE